MATQREDAAVLPGTTASRFGAGEGARGAGAADAEGATPEATLMQIVHDSLVAQAFGAAAGEEGGAEE